MVSLPSKGAVMAHSTPNRMARSLAAVVASVLLLAGCSFTSATAANLDSAPQEVEAGSLFDSSFVHDIDVTFDDADYAELINDYVETGEKSWIAATVVIDGTTFEDAGIRLKGNSSLFGLNEATSGNPEDLPWLIRLDKYVDGVEYDGYTDIVIRSNSTETAMNEAVAQELLDLVGLANQDPIATTFTVNGGETELRLAVEHPDDAWDDANFDDDDGVLYKADSEGDYSYRGDDAEAYEEVFGQKAGDDDYEPLISFLDFVNNSDDATFDAELADRLDVDAFATYLAFQDLIGNADDIDGRGNNSYLHYDYETEQFTVVSWDLNLAFNTANVSGGGGPGGAGGDVAAAGGRGDRPGGGARPERVAPEADAGAAAPGAAGPGGGGSNVLVDRFMANAEFIELYNAKTDELSELLFTSGTAASVVAEWSNLLAGEAGALVDTTTLTAEAVALTTFISTRS